MPTKDKVTSQFRTKYIWWGWSQSIFIAKFLALNMTTGQNVTLSLFFWIMWPSWYSVSGNLYYWGSVSTYFNNIRRSWLMFIVDSNQGWALGWILRSKTIHNLRWIATMDIKLIAIYYFIAYNDPESTILFKIELLTRKL